MVLYLRLRENIYTIRLNNEVLAVCDPCGWTRERISVNGRGDMPWVFLDLVAVKLCLMIEGFERAGWIPQQTSTDQFGRTGLSVRGRGG